MPVSAALKIASFVLGADEYLERLGDEIRKCLQFFYGFNFRKPEFHPDFI